MDPQQVLVNNLFEALRQLQRYLVLALVASLSLALLQISSAPPTAGRMIQLPGLVTSVDVSMAKLILGAAHVTLGLLTIAASENAMKIASRIDDQKLREAALSYPSLATDNDPWIRVPACLAPALFFLIALVALVLRHPERGWDFVILAFCLGVLPYVLLVVRAQQFGKASMPATADATDSKKV